MSATPPGRIRLDRFLKLRGLVETGGHAKALIVRGEVSVGGDVEVRRSRKLVPGDVVDIAGHRVTVAPEDVAGDEFS